jgi:predicted RNA-binding Zn ribbon-like protein
MILALAVCRCVTKGHPGIQPMTAARPPPFFIADHMGLDFLNSIAVPVDVKVEWLSSGEDFLAWLKQAGLVPDEILEAFRKRSLPGELDAIAAQARALRDWFKPFVYKHMGRPIGRNALRHLEPLNQLLARDDEFGQIVAGDRRSGHERQYEVNNESSGLAWRLQRRWHSPESLLLPITRALADLVCTEDFTYVKACEGPACTLLFIDRTRGRGRRWCSMAVCGNRAKQAAHRERALQSRKGSG